MAPGAEALAAERRDSEHGAAKEAAALGALRLLRLGFERDEDVVRALRRGEAGGPRSRSRVVPLRATCRARSWLRVRIKRAGLG